MITPKDELERVAYVKSLHKALLADTAKHMSELQEMIARHQQVIRTYTTALIELEQNKPVEKK